MVGGGEPFYFYIRGFFVPLAKATNLQQPLFDLFLLIYLTTPSLSPHPSTPIPRRSPSSASKVHSSLFPWNYILKLVVGFSVMIKCVCYLHEWNRWNVGGEGGVVVGIECTRRITRRGNIICFTSDKCLRYISIIKA